MSHPGKRDGAHEVTDAVDEQEPLKRYSLPSSAATKVQMFAGAGCGQKQAPRRRFQTGNQDRRRRSSFLMLDQTLLSNTTQVFFGVNDYPTAEYVSIALESTISR